MDYMDMSLTEHHIKGAGILASRRDLDLPPAEFAAGCNLLQAAARGDVKELEALLEAHPDHVNFRDYDRRTALHVAASEGHLSVVIFLLERGAKIHRSDRWGGSPLDDAHRHQQVEVARYLRSRGATTGSLNQTTNFITAAANGDLEEVELLVNAIKNIDEGDYDKRTALHLAAGEGHVKVVEFLLKHGANPNAEDRWGGRPLEDAMRNQHAACVTLLKKYGAQLGIHDRASSHSAEMEQDPYLQIEFSELEMIERIGSGAFGEIYKCRWRGTLVAAKIIKTAKIRKEWLARHAMSQANGDDAAQMLDEAADMEERKEEALADFRQEVSVLKSLR
jgi:ankyrin repeat protein